MRDNIQVANSGAFHYYENGIGFTVSYPYITEQIQVMEIHPDGVNPIRGDGSETGADIVYEF